MNACNLTLKIRNNFTATESMLYYLSVKYMHDSAIEDYAEHTTAPMKKRLRNAKFGANFSPTAYYIDPRDGKQYCQLYIGWTYQWINVFRKGALTLPWSEDWVWQTPVGTQQMMTLSLDAMRSGIYWADEAPSVSASQALSTLNHDGQYQPLALPTKHVDMLMYVMKHYPGQCNPLRHRLSDQIPRL